MQIRPLETKEDLDGKAYVHHWAWQEAYTGLVDQAFLDKRTLEQSRQRAERAFESGVKTLLAVDGDRIVGFADYGPYRWEDLADAGEVYALYILKEYYGAGVGRALMREALSRLADRPRAAVWVLRGNERAIRFYTKCGFRFDGAEQTLTMGTEITDLRMVCPRGQEQ